MKKQKQYLVVTDWIGGSINAYLPCKTLKEAREVREGLIDDNPFGNYKIIKRETTYKEVK